MQITVKFNFDTETNEISNMTVVNFNKEVNTSFEKLVTLDKTSLILNDEILNYLNLGIDQKVILKVLEDDTVILYKPNDAKIKTDSYRVTSKLTINVRGEKQKKLQALGGEFKPMTIIYGEHRAVSLISTKI